MMFLSEGTKILFRMGYAIMKKLHEDILTLQDPATVIPTLKSLGPKTIKDSDYIITWGFKMGLTRFNNTYIEQKRSLTQEQLALHAKVLFACVHSLSSFTSTTWTFLRPSSTSRTYDGC